MSNAALTWAFAAKVKRSSDKFLLVALANYADDSGLCWPSQAQLIDDTALDRKTVVTGLGRLSGAGMIEDTGTRKGKTAQVVIYRLALGTVPKTDPLNSPENGTIAADETVPFFPPNSPVFPAEQFRFSLKGAQKRDTEPLEPPKEPSGNPHKQRARVADAAGFAEWWASYPRKTGKDDARKAFASALGRGVTAAELILSVRKYPFGTDVHWMKHPATWLTKGCWQDDHAAVAPDPAKKLNAIDAALRRMTEKPDDYLAYLSDEERELLTERATGVRDAQSDRATIDMEAE